MVPQTAEMPGPRDPETRAAVSLVVAVAARGDSPATPGQTSVTCAEFALAKHGDSGGASAGVPGVARGQDWRVVGAGEDRALSGSSHVGFVAVTGGGVSRRPPGILLPLPLLHGMLVRHWVETLSCFRHLPAADTAGEFRRATRRRPLPNVYTACSPEVRNESLSKRRQETRGNETGDSG